jgi:hypothetical protein
MASEKKGLPMQPITLAQLNQRYQQLRDQVQANQISQDQFIQSVHQLQAADEAGNWWAIDPHSGGYLKYSGTDWVPANPPSTPAQTQPAQLADDLPGPLKGRSCCLASPVMVGIMSFGTAGFWLIYSSIRVSNFRYLDILTPLMIACLPLLMRVFQKQIDNIAKPLYAITSKFPYATRSGAAMAIPIVLGVTTSSLRSGYGPIRFTMLVSIVGGYILTRRVN